MGISVSKLKDTEDIESFLRDNHPYLVYSEQILALANTTVINICNVKGCGQAVEIQTETVGSAVYLKWVDVSVYIL